MVNKNDLSDIIKFLTTFAVALAVFLVILVAAYNWEGRNILDYLDARISTYLDAQWLKINRQEPIIF